MATIMLHSVNNPV